MKIMLSQTVLGPLPKECTASLAIVTVRVHVWPRGRVFSLSVDLVACQCIPSVLSSSEIFRFSFSLDCNYCE